MNEVSWLTVIVSVIVSTSTVTLILNKFTKQILDNVNEDIMEWSKDIINTINKIL